MDLALHLADFLPREEGFLPISCALDKTASQREPLSCLSKMNMLID
jgi:hypothetical protein